MKRSPPGHRGCANSLQILSVLLTAAACTQYQRVDPYASRKAAILQEEKPNIGKRKWVQPYATVDRCPEPAGILGKGCKPIPGGTGFTIKDVVFGYTDTSSTYLVAFDDGSEGYVSRTSTTLQLQDEDPRAQAKRENEKLAAAAAECARRGKPRVGMTGDQVRASCWGNPQKINRTTTANVVSEQYVYRFRNTYVYLENGIVTAVQD